MPWDPKQTGSTAQQGGDNVYPNAFDAVTSSARRTRYLPRRPALKSWVGANFSGHGWTAIGSGTASSEMNDLTDFQSGDRSARITTGTTAANFSAFSKTGLTLDATGCGVRVLFKMGLFTQSDKISVVLQTSAGNTFNAYSFVDFVNTYGGSDSGGAVKPDTWTYLDIPWSVFTTTGSPVRSNITAVQVTVQSRDGQASTYRLGGVGLYLEDETNRWPNGVLSITMDDGAAGQSSIALPYLDRYGERATLYPIVDVVGTGSAMTLADLKRHAHNGHEIGSHSATLASHQSSWNSFTDDQLYAEMEAMRAWQDTNGFTSGSLAYPLGNWNTNVASIAGRYFTSVRTVSAGSSLEPARPTNRTFLRAMDISSQSSTNIKARMDKAKAGKAWLILYSHGFVAASPTGNQTDLAKLTDVMDYARSIGLPVRPVGEVIAAAS